MSAKAARIKLASIIFGLGIFPVLSFAQPVRVFYDQKNPGFNIAYIEIEQNAASTRTTYRICHVDAKAVMAVGYDGDFAEHGECETLGRTQGYTAAELQKMSVLFKGKRVANNWKAIGAGAAVAATGALVLVGFSAASPALAAAGLAVGIFKDVGAMVFIGSVLAVPTGGAVSVAGLFTPYRLDQDSAGFLTPETTQAPGARHVQVNVEHVAKILRLTFKKFDSLPRTEEISETMRLPENQPLLQMP